MAVVTRLFDNHVEALEAVAALEAAGFEREEISLVSNNADNWHASRGDRTDRKAGDLNGDGENDIADGAGKGAATGGVLGAGAGVLAGLGMLAIPGLGPVVAAGWLASAAAAALGGAAVGGAAGGLLGALKEAGHSDEDAHVYAESVRRGGTLVSVRTDEAEKGRAEALLDDRRGFDAASRAGAYRETGWSTFDPAAEPWTAEQIEQERARYR